MNINSHITTRKILQKYSQLLPTDQFRTWEGYINVNDHDIKLKAAVPFYPLIQEMKLELGIEMAKHLRPTTIESLLQCNDFLQVLDMLVFELRSKCGDSNITSSVLWPDTHMSLLRSLLREVKTSVGLDNLVNIDEDLKWVRLKYEDSTGESHEITVEIPPGFSKGSEDLRVSGTDLPSSSLARILGMRNVGEIYNAFTGIVESLVPFWKMCKEFDYVAWVLDPENPSKQHTYRRIYLDNMTSVLITFDPNNIYEAPEVNFCGVFKTAGAFTETYHKNIETIGWDAELSVAENFERLLEIPKLPQRPDRKDDIKNPDSSMICAICLDTAADNTSVPGRWCPNDKCSSVFHHECLLKWFQSLPSINSLFDHTGGPCPSCKTKTWCPAKGNSIAPS